jgi:hypothetical protein
MRYFLGYYYYYSEIDYSTNFPSSDLILSSWDCRSHHFVYTRKIAKIERMSIRDISPTLKEEESKRQKHKDQQQQEELFAKTYELFSEGKRPVEVAISNLSEK